MSEKNLITALVLIVRYTEITDALGLRTLTYNDSLQPDTDKITGIYNREIIRKYDTVSNGTKGRPTGFSMGPDYSISYGYDTAGRLTGFGWNAAGSQKTATYHYLPNSDRIEMLEIGSGVSNDIATTYGYSDPRKNLRTQVRNGYKGNLISQYDYKYDEFGQRTSVTNTGPAFASPAGAFNIYSYNDRSELTGSSHYNGTNLSDLNSPVPAEFWTYAYDPIGNRTQATEHTTTLTYNANILNQYEQIASSAGQPENPAYDDDGNMTAYAGRKYIYNAENRLITVTYENPAQGQKKVTFVYDYMGRRVKKTVSVWDGLAWTDKTEKFFVYDGWNLIEEITKKNAVLTSKYYVWGLDLSRTPQGAGGIGGLLASSDKSSPDVYYYFYDANGNVGQLVDSAGSIAARYEYDPFGNVIFKDG